MALFHTGNSHDAPTQHFAAAIFQQSLQNKNMLARTQQQPSFSRLMPIDLASDIRASFGQEPDGLREGEQRGRQADRRKTWSSSTPQACFTVPYPGTVLQEQRPLSRQLWRKRTEW